MPRIRSAFALFLTVSIVAACSDDTTSPEVDECEPETAAVSPTITVAESVVFDWEPACGVALLLVEEGASDRWAINTDEQSWETPEQANQIFPPVTYGLAPAGVQELPAEELVVGRVYELVLWRVLPDGETEDCIATLENACLIAVHEFTR